MKTISTNGNTEGRKNIPFRILNLKHNVSDLLLISNLDLEIIRFSILPSNFPHSVVNNSLKTWDKVIWRSGKGILEHNGSQCLWRLLAEVGVIRLKDFCFFLLKSKFRAVFFFHTFSTEPFVLHLLRISEEVFEHKGRLWLVRRVRLSSTSSFDRRLSPSAFINRGN